PPPTPPPFPYTTLFRSQQRWSIPHTRSMHDKMHQAQMTLTKVDEYADAFEKIVEQLTVTTPSEDQARKMLENAIRSGGKGRDERSEEHTSELQSRENLV